MADLEYQAGIAVIGLAAFQIASLWNDNAPSLAELRDHDPNNYSPTSALQKLSDADWTVGLLVAVVALATTTLTKDWRPAAVMIIIFGVLSYQAHTVAKAPNK